MKKSLTIIALLCLSLFAQDKPKEKKAEDAKAPAPISVPEKDKLEIGNLWNEAVIASQGLSYASGLLSDGSGCVKQALLLLQKDAEGKFARYQNKVLALRIDLSVPKNWDFDKESLVFKAPAKP